MLRECSASLRVLRLDEYSSSDLVAMAISQCCFALESVSFELQEEGWQQLTHAGIMLLGNLAANHRLRCVEVRNSGGFGGDDAFQYSPILRVAPPPFHAFPDACILK